MASSNSGVSFFASHRLMWQCRPLPVRFANGFGITVASSPRICASEWIMYRWKMTRSAVVNASAYWKFDSNCPFASSWSFA